MQSAFVQSCRMSQVVILGATPPNLCKMGGLIAIQGYHALLSMDDSAGSVYAEIKDKYPIVLTRDMEKAKAWLHKQVRGSERTGVLITKESARYKPLGVHVLPPGNSHITPSGFPDDGTRLPEFYDGTYEYLKGLGVEEI